MSTGQNRSTFLGQALFGGSVLLIGVVLTLGALAATGRIPLPFWSGKAVIRAPGQPEGTIAVPITAQSVPAYTRLTRDHFWDTKTGRFTVIYLYPDDIRPGMLTNLNDILNRVLATEKKPGYAVTESELLPKGTRPGLAGGTPPGKRALTLEAARLHGIYGLRIGDRIDLVASVPVDAKPTTSDLRVLLNGTRPSGPLSAAKKQANVVVLAENAIVVSPVTVRPVPGPKSKAAQSKPIEELTIAVSPEEVARLSEALAVDAVITAVMRSGRPDEVEGPVKPASSEEPPPPPTLIETIRAGQRTTLIFGPDGERIGTVAGGIREATLGGRRAP